jgi:hypothetical protein
VSLCVFAPAGVLLFSFGVPLGETTFTLNMSYKKPSKPGMTNGYFFIFIFYGM